MTLIRLLVLLAIFLPTQAFAVDCLGVTTGGYNAVMETLTQTVCNKTFDNTNTYSGGTITSPTIDSPTITDPTITGTVAGGASYTGPTITSPAITGTVSGGATYSSPTLTTPTLTTPTATGSTLGTTKQLTENVVFVDKFSTVDLCEATNGAIDQIGATVTTLVINKAVTCTATKTAPTTLQIVVIGQGDITTSAVQVLTLNGPFDAPRRQVFKGSGTVAGFNWAYPEWWGSNTTPGTTDMTAAFTSAVASLGNNSLLDLDATTYLWTSTVTISADRVHLKGKGQYATIIQFTPTADDVALSMTAGASVIYQGSVSDLAFRSSDSTYTKVAIDLIDSSGYWLENIVVGGSVTVGGADFWSGGTGSIGLRLKGREFTQVRNLYDYADKPVVIADNPNSTLDIDHAHFQDLYLGSNTTFACVTIEDGVNLSNVEFDGANPWVGGAYGLYWNDTTTTSVSNHLKIRGVRTEQGTDATAYSVYISHNFKLQNFHIEDTQLDNNRKGIYLRKVQAALLETTAYGGALEAFNAVADTDSTLTCLECFFQAGSTATLTNYTQVLGSGRQEANKPIPNTAMYVYDAGADTDGLILQHQIMATGSLPAASAAMDGRIIIEDAGAGDRNIIVYAGGQRFRIDGGAAF